MLVVSLTSVPARFATLGRTLESLLAQEPRPDEIRLTLPRRYRRFPDWDGTLPELPRGIALHSTAEDLGPATKALPAAAELRGTGARLLWCDDDWLYAPGWLAVLHAASAETPEAAIAGSGYSARRLGLPAPLPAPGHADIAQGFAGVLIRPSQLPDAAWEIPEPAWSVDDVWLSGMLALAGVPIRLAPDARARCTPHGGEAAPLQLARPDGRSRGEANRDTALWLARHFGIWR